MGGTVSEYLSTIEGADRDALERVYAIARELVPEAEEGTSYGMPALIYRGKGLVSTLRTTKFLSLYPYSGAVVAANLKVLAGFETTSGSIHFTAEHPLPDAAVRRIVETRRAEIDAKAR
ncbi:MAG: iron chaperone [Actinomycetales bacterium]